MTEIAIQNEPGAAQGAELVSVLTQYASDFFSNYEYDQLNEKLIFKNTGDNTAWVTIRIASALAVRTTFFDGTYAGTSSTFGINCVYVSDNFVALCNKNAANSTFYPACIISKNTLGEVCCFYEAQYNTQTSLQYLSDTSQETYSNPSMLMLINTTRRSVTKIPVGDMISHIQIVNAIPIYDTKDTKLDGVYFNTMGALKDMFELTEFMHNGHTYYSVMCGRFIVEDA